MAAQKDFTCKLTSSERVRNLIDNDEKLLDELYIKASYLIKDAKESLVFFEFDEKEFVAVKREFGKDLKEYNYWAICVA